jgi:preprotein translocase subunit SecA
MRGYAQIDPKLAYKKEGYEAFAAMIANIQEEVSDLVLRVDIDLGIDVHEETKSTQLVHSSASAYESQQEQAVAASTTKSDGPRPLRAAKQTDRNAPCPCGSGKKFKNCCMGK